MYAPNIAAMNFNSIVFTVFLAFHSHILLRSYHDSTPILKYFTGKQSSFTSKSSEARYATITWFSFPSFRRYTASSGNEDGIIEVKSILGQVLRYRDNRVKTKRGTKAHT